MKIFFILEEKNPIKMTEVGDRYNIVSKEGSQDTTRGTDQGK